jgi:alpha-beta hydrolase superfamily lysophospholipase
VRYDPLSLRRITLRFARADQQITQYAREAPPFLRMPTLLVLAGRDRIVQNDRMRRYLDSVAAEHKTLLEYPEASHTLEFERDPLPYFNDFAQWIRRTIEK